MLEKKEEQETGLLYSGKIYWGILPNQQRLSFLEKSLEDQSGFDVLGIDRQSFVNCLLEAAEDEKSKTIIAEEILNWLIQPENQKILSLPLEISKKISAYLDKNNTFEVQKKIRKELLEYSQTKLIYCGYVNQYLKDLPLGYQAAILYAKLKKITLYIWRYGKTINELVLKAYTLSTHINGSIEPIHLFSISHTLHYHQLTVIKSENKKKLEKSDNTNNVHFKLPERVTTRNKITTKQIRNTKFNFEMESYNKKQLKAKKIQHSEQTANEKLPDLPDKPSNLPWIRIPTAYQDLKKLLKMARSKSDYKKLGKKDLDYIVYYCDYQGKFSFTDNRRLAKIAIRILSYLAKYQWKIPEKAILIVEKELDWSFALSNFSFIEFKEITNIPMEDWGKAQCNDKELFNKIQLIKDDKEAYKKLRLSHQETLSIEKVLNNKNLKILSAKLLLEVQDDWAKKILPNAIMTISHIILNGQFVKKETLNKLIHATKALKKMRQLYYEPIIILALAAISKYFIQSKDKSVHDIDTFQLDKAELELIYHTLIDIYEKNATLRFPAVCKQFAQENYLGFWNTVFTEKAIQNIKELSFNGQALGKNDLIFAVRTWDKKFDISIRTKISHTLCFSLGNGLPFLPETKTAYPVLANMLTHEETKVQLNAIYVTRYLVKNSQMNDKKVISKYNQSIKMTRSYALLTLNNYLMVHGSKSLNSIQMWMELLNKLSNDSDEDIASKAKYGLFFIEGKLENLENMLLQLDGCVIAAKIFLEAASSGQMLSNQAIKNLSIILSKEKYPSEAKFTAIHALFAITENNQVLGKEIISIVLEKALINQNDIFIQNYVLMILGYCIKNGEREFVSEPFIKQITSFYQHENTCLNASFLLASIMEYCGNINRFNNLSELFDLTIDYLLDTKINENDKDNLVAMIRNAAEKAYNFASKIPIAIQHIILKSSHIDFKHSLIEVLCLIFKTAEIIKLENEMLNALIKGISEENQATISNTHFLIDQSIRKTGSFAFANLSFEEFKKVKEITSTKKTDWEKIKGYNEKLFIEIQNITNDKNSHKKILFSNEAIECLKKFLDDKNEKKLSIKLIKEPMNNDNIIALSNYLEKPDLKYKISHHFLQMVKKKWCLPTETLFKLTSALTQQDIDTSYLIADLLKNYVQYDHVNIDVFNLVTEQSLHFDAYECEIHEALSVFFKTTSAHYIKTQQVIKINPKFIDNLIELVSNPSISLQSRENFIYTIYHIIQCGQMISIKSLEKLSEIILLSQERSENDLCRAILICIQIPMMRYISNHLEEKPFQNILLHVEACIINATYNLCAIDILHKIRHMTFQLNIKTIQHLMYLLSHDENEKLRNYSYDILTVQKHYFYKKDEKFFTQIKDLLDLENYCRDALLLSDYKSCLNRMETFIEKGLQLTFSGKMAVKKLVDSKYEVAYSKIINIFHICLVNNAQVFSYDFLEMLSSIVKYKKSEHGAQALAAAINLGSFVSKETYHVFEVVLDEHKKLGEACLQALIIGLRNNYCQVSEHTVIFLLQMMMVETLSDKSRYLIVDILKLTKENNLKGKFNFLIKMTEAILYEKNNIVRKILENIILDFIGKNGKQINNEQMISLVKLYQFTDQHEIKSKLSKIINNENEKNPQNKMILINFKENTLLEETILNTSISFHERNQAIFKYIEKNNFIPENICDAIFNQLEQVNLENADFLYESILFLPEKIKFKASYFDIMVKQIFNHDTSSKPLDSLIETMIKAKLSFPTTSLNLLYQQLLYGKSKNIRQYIFQLFSKIKDYQEIEEKIIDVLSIETDLEKDYSNSEADKLIDKMVILTNKYQILSLNNIIFILHHSPASQYKKIINIFYNIKLTIPEELHSFILSFFIENDFIFSEKDQENAHKVIHYFLKKRCISPELAKQQLNRIMKLLEPSKSNTTRLLYLYEILESYEIKLVSSDINILVDLLNKTNHIADQKIMIKLVIYGLLSNEDQAFTNFINIANILGSLNSTRSESGFGTISENNQVKMFFDKISNNTKLLLNNIFVHDTTNHLNKNHIIPFLCLLSAMQINNNFFSSNPDSALDLIIFYCKKYKCCPFNEEHQFTSKDQKIGSIQYYVVKIINMLMTNNYNYDKDEKKDDTNVNELIKQIIIFLLKGKNIESELSYEVKIKLFLSKITFLIEHMKDNQEFKLLINPERYVLFMLVLKIYCDNYKINDLIKYITILGCYDNFSPQILLYGNDVIYHKWIMNYLTRFFKNEEISQDTINNTIDKIDRLHWDYDTINDFFCSLDKIDDIKKLDYLLDLIHEYHIDIFKINYIIDVSLDIDEVSILFWINQIELEILSERFAKLGNFILSHAYFKKSEDLQFAIQYLNEKVVVLKKNGWTFQNIYQLVNRLIKYASDVRQETINVVLTLLDDACYYALDQIEFLKIIEKNDVKVACREIHRLIMKKHYDTFEEKELPVFLDELYSQLDEQTTKNVPTRHKFVLMIEQLDHYYKNDIELPSKYIQKSNSTDQEVQPIWQWEGHKIQDWVHHIRTECKPSEENLLPEILAVTKRACFLCFKCEPRNAQIIAILLLVYKQGDIGRIIEVATGEGKSIIIGILTVILSLRGEQVDNVTSSPLLATRDASDFKNFFSLFYLYSGSNDQPNYKRGIKSCYQSSFHLKQNRKIIYGSVSNFQFDILYHEFNDLKTRGSRGFNSVVVDEADNILIDEGNRVAMLANMTPAMQHITPWLIFIWIKIHQLRQNIVKKDDNSYFLGESEPVIIPNDDDKALHQFIVARVILAIEQLKQSKTYPIPNHLEDFFESQFKHWIDSAFLAITVYEYKRHYDIKTDNQNQRSIIPVDFANTGMHQSMSRWNNGLQQFLQIKHGLPISSINLTTNYISNIDFFNRYKKYKQDSNITKVEKNNLYGLTGTLGSEHAQKTLTSVYQVDLIKIPTHKVKQFYELPSILTLNENTWEYHIITSACREAYRDRVTLIVCEAISVAEAIYEKINTIYRLNNVILYKESNDTSDEVFADPLGPGTIIVSTNLSARGANIKITGKTIAAGGLHVCLTYLPDNEQVYWQIMGRAARKGEPGSGQIILDLFECGIKYNLSVTEIQSLYQTQDITPLKSIRDRHEKNRLEKFEKHHVPVLETKGVLFRKFCNLIKICKQMECHKEDKEKRVKNNYIRSALEERWALWLLACDFENKSSEILLNDFAQFEETIKDDYQKGDMIKNPVYYIMQANSHLVQANKYISILTYKSHCDKAIQLFECAIELDSQYSVIAYYNKAYALLLKGQGYEESKAAKLLLEKVVTLQNDIFVPLHQSVLNGLSFICLQKMYQPSHQDLVQQLQIRLQMAYKLISLSEAGIKEINISKKPVHIKYHQGNEKIQYKKIVPTEALQLIQNSNNECFHITFHDLIKYRDPVVFYDSDELFKKKQENSGIKFKYVTSEPSILPGNNISITGLLPINRHKKDEKKEKNEQNTVNHLSNHSENNEVQNDKQDELIDNPIGFYDNISAFGNKVSKKVKNFASTAKDTIIEKTGDIVLPVAKKVIDTKNYLSDQWNNYDLVTSINVTLKTNTVSFQASYNILQTISSENINLSVKFKSLTFSQGREIKKLLKNGYYQNDNLFNVDFLSIKINEKDNVHYISKETVTDTKQSISENENSRYELIIKKSSPLFLYQLFTFLQEKIEFTKDIVVTLRLFDLQQENVSLVLEKIQKGLDNLENSMKLNWALYFNNLNKDRAKVISRVNDEAYKDATITLSDVSKDELIELLQIILKSEKAPGVTTNSFSAEFLKTYNSQVDLLELQENGYLYFFHLYQKKVLPFRSLIMLGTLAAAQIITGVALVALTAGFGSNFGSSLISEGISDLLRMAQIVYSREFDLTSYIWQKSLSMSLSLLTAGYSTWKNTAKTASEVEKAIVNNADEGLIMSLQLTQNTAQESLVKSQSLVSTIQNVSSQTQTVGQKIIENAVSESKGMGFAVRKFLYELVETGVKEGAKSGINYAVDEYTNYYENIKNEQVKNEIENLFTDQSWIHTTNNILIVDKLDGNAKLCEKLMYDVGEILNKTTINENTPFTHDILGFFERDFSNVLEKYDENINHNYNFENLLFSKLNAKNNQMTLSDTKNICELLKKMKILDNQNAVNFHSVLTKTTQKSDKNIAMILMTDIDMNLIDFKQYQKYRKEIIRFCYDYMMLHREDHYLKRTEIIQNISEAISKYLYSNYSRFAEISKMALGVVSSTVIGHYSQKIQDKIEQACAQNLTMAEEIVEEGNLARDRGIRKTRVRARRQNNRYRKTQRLKAVPVTENVSDQIQIKSNIDGLNPPTQNFGESKPVTISKLEKIPFKGGFKHSGLSGKTAGRTSSFPKIEKMPFKGQFKHSGLSGKTPGSPSSFPKVEKIPFKGGFKHSGLPGKTPGSSSSFPKVEKIPFKGGFKHSGLPGKTPGSPPSFPKVEKMPFKGQFKHSELPGKTPGSPSSFPKVEKMPFKNQQPPLKSPGKNSSFFDNKKEASQLLELKKSQSMMPLSVTNTFIDMKESFTIKRESTISHLFVKNSLTAVKQYCQNQIEIYQNKQRDKRIEHLEKNLQWYVENQNAKIKILLAELEDMINCMMSVIIIELELNSLLNHTEALLNTHHEIEQKTLNEENIKQKIINISDKALIDVGQGYEIFKCYIDKNYLDTYSASDNLIKLENLFKKYANIELNKIEMKKPIAKRSMKSNASIIVGSLQSFGQGMYDTRLGKLLESGALSTVGYVAHNVLQSVLYVNEISVKNNQYINYCALSILEYVVNNDQQTKLMVTSISEEYTMIAMTINKNMAKNLTKAHHLMVATNIWENPNISNEKKQELYLNYVQQVKTVLNEITSAYSQLANRVIDILGTDVTSRNKQFIEDYIQSSQSIITTMIDSTKKIIEAPTLNLISEVNNICSKIKDKLKSKEENNAVDESEDNSGDLSEMKSQMSDSTNKENNNTEENIQAVEDDILIFLEENSFEKDEFNIQRSIQSIDIYNDKKNQQEITQNKIITNNFEINALGDGNCAYNSFALSLGQLVVAFKEKLPEKIKQALVSLFHKAIILNKLPNTIKNYPDIITYFEKNTHQTWQLNLAFPLRILAVICLQNNKARCESYFNFLKDSYEIFAFDTQFDNRDQTFIVHDFILNKFKALKNSYQQYEKLDIALVDLREWWERIGWKTYLEEISQSAKYPGDVPRWGGQELEILAQYFHIGIEYTQNHVTSSLFTPFGQIDELDGEIAKLLRSRGIIEPNATGWHIQQQMIVFEEIETRCADLTDLLDEDTQLMQSIKNSQQHEKENGDWVIEKNDPILRSKVFEQLVIRGIIAKDDHRRYKFVKDVVNAPEILKQRLIAIPNNIIQQIKQCYQDASGLLVKLGYNGGHWWSHGFDDFGSNINHLPFHHQKNTEKTSHQQQEKKLTNQPKEEPVKKEKLKDDLVHNRNFYFLIIKNYFEKNEIIDKKILELLMSAIKQAKQENFVFMLSVENQNLKGRELVQYYLENYANDEENKLSIEFFKTAEYIRDNINKNQSKTEENTENKEDTSEQFSPIYLKINNGNKTKNLSQQQENPNTENETNNTNDLNTTINTNKQAEKEGKCHVF